MEILTWSDPKYFMFANALIRSIRYHGNNNLIHVNLMDFNLEQTGHVMRMFSKDSRINFISTNSNQFDYKVNNKKEFYRNYRPRLFLDLLKKSKEGKLCTFGANGIVFTKLDYIEKLLDKNDFVFLEREKQNIFTKDPEKVAGINDVQALVEKGHPIDEILNATTGKVVLLGTHAMRNNDVCIDVLQKWINLIENTDSINKTFSDMNYFVKSVIAHQTENNTKINMETSIGTPRDTNPYCDTRLNDGTKIWFAKGNSKWNSKKYLDKVDFFAKYEYEL